VDRTDVAILGGGLAGNLLARQLRRQLPDLAVAVFEPQPEAERKVGESTVEIASDYLIRRHDLSSYLYEHQLQKNGLRFFFDTPAKDAELLQMSELGSDHIPLFPTFQLDRARFENDLRAMNADAEVAMHIGDTVRDVELGAPHVVKVRGEGGEREVAARWVVDCSGRARTLARKLDLTRPVDHELSAVWGRFGGVVDFDAIGAPDWRGRVRYTARTLSTNHFCYPGYWIWFIPLGEGVTSLGIVGEKSVFRRGARTPDGFLSSLREHRAVASLLERAEIIDLGGYTQLGYRTERFWDGDARWATIGDAGAFVDPLYSPGSDFISLQCDLVSDLIARDVRGDADATRVARDYDAYMQLRFEATLLLYQDQYPAIGSYEAMCAKWNFDLATYYNLWLDTFMRDSHLDPRHCRTQVRRRAIILEALEEFRLRFAKMAELGLASGRYYRDNLGRYNPGTDLDWFWREIGTPDRKRRRRTEVTMQILDAVREETRPALEQLPARGERRA